MNEADWAISCILIIFSVISFWRGFVKEAISLIVWITAFGLSLSIAPKLAFLLISFIESNAVRMIGSFIIIFFGTLIVGGLVSRLLISIVKFSGLGGADRFLGMSFGFFKGALLILIFLIIFPIIFDAKQFSWYQKSTLIPHFNVFGNWAKNNFSEVSYWSQKLDIFSEDLKGSN